MIAVDKTAVFMGQRSQTTIDQGHSASSVYIPSSSYKNASVTCILAIHLNESKPHL